MANRHYMKAGDLAPAISATLTYSDGNPLDLTTATNPRFIMRLPNATTAKVYDVATIVNAAAGQVRYDWTDTDTDTAGLYHAEWEFIIGGKRITAPNGGYIYVHIVEDLG